MGNADAGDGARRRPILYVLSGLPGSGKSTLGARLAAARRGVYLRIDTIEQGLRDLCGVTVSGEGYRLAYRLAADNLRNGVDVVGDSCNLFEFTRREWEGVAVGSRVAYRHIEVVCSDVDEHRRRVETRRAGIPGLRLPTWEQVVARERQPWTMDHLVVDTAGRTVEACLGELLAALDG